MWKASTTFLTKTKFYFYVILFNVRAQQVSNFTASAEDFNHCNMSTTQNSNVQIITKLTKTFKTFIKCWKLKGAQNSLTIW